MSRWFRAGGAGTRAVVALGLSVVLAGCSPAPAQPFTPVDLPAGTSDPSQPAVGAPATVAPTVTAETVEVSPDVRLVVEWPAAPDPDTVEMIKAFRDHTAGTFRAVVTGGRDVSYLRTVEAGAVKDANAWVQGFLDQRRSVRGTARLYALRVDQDGLLNVCVDQSEMRLLDSVTGSPVRRQPAWTRKPFLQTAVVRRDDDGVWRIGLFRYAELPSESAKGCLR